MRGGTYRQFHPTVLVSFVSLEPTAPSGGYASQRADVKFTWLKVSAQPRWGAQVESVFSAVVAGPGACN